jgi:hypothetical protein
MTMSYHFLGLVSAYEQKHVMFALLTLTYRRSQDDLQFHPFA